MKISLNWIKDYVDLGDIDIKEIVSRFSLATAEVEGYEIKGANLDKVVVGQIITCDSHPTNKKLHVLTVNNGEAVVPVICGAPNCRTGMKVAFSKIGATIGGVTIGKATISGCESHGMCCSGRELGISTDHDGIIELDQTAKVGMPITAALPEVADVIIEIDNKSLTNRPDLWGHYGIAREMATIFGKKLKSLSLADLTKYDTLPKIPIVIENKTDCLSYGAIRVDNLTRAKSPLFMQTRLFFCGINAHNFLVDLTNYLMLELAQPNHAFDASKVGKISIGNMPAGSQFTTLKNQTINTTPEMLFIKSDGQPVALAGVMGGKNSEIADDTKDCVFEYATFDATCIRKTATSLGIRTDASNRYEKSLDTNLNVLSAGRMVKLIETYDKTARVASRFSRAIGHETQSIALAIGKSYLEHFCGITFNYADVKKHLAALGFAPEINADKISVTVPTWRATKDISCTADLIEEIVRTFGYDNIKPAAPKVALAPVEQLRDREITARIKNLLCDKYAFDEVHTYVWNDTKFIKQFNIQTQSLLRVVNSCVKDNDAIRSEMIPSMLGVVAKNRGHEEVRIFEIGRVVTGLNKDNTAVEEKQLGLAIASKNIGDEQLYKHLADILRDVFGILGYSLKFDLSSAKNNYFHPKNNATIRVNQGTKKQPIILGNIGIIHPSCRGAELQVKGLACAQINLTALNSVSFAENHTKAVSKYQKNTLDFTFQTDKVYGDIEAIFDKFSHPLNMGYHLKDVYAESDGKINYTLQFIIGSFERTLTSVDTDDFVTSVIKHGRAAGLTLN